jgi:hypothetical protein
MHTYRLGSENLWQVGHFNLTDGKWHTMIEYPEEGQAMRMVNYLNGGTGKPHED